MPNLEASTQIAFSRIIERRFFNTGDLDYISARVLFFHGLTENFLWSALQSAEKHLKAALLFRKIPTGKTHNIEKLYDLLLTSDDVLEPPPIDYSESIEFLDPECFTVADIVTKLNFDGHSSVRYGEFKYEWSIYDLIAFDWLIKWGRIQSQTHPNFFERRKIYVSDAPVTTFGAVRLTEKTSEALFYNNFAFGNSPDLQYGPGLLHMSTDDAIHRYALAQNDVRGIAARKAEAELLDLIKGKY
ncbi:HEPN domain-containing protein [uncultured Jannaschia sp.]|uniref:HEPN domain-containing protein n=1 Tax=uncultured Jannaschia sp. TaxID=293347 RepID=UPI002630ADB5|nr:HEPN domain-containing protein [uncultured Jannaschia sp.]